MSHAGFVHAQQTAARERARAELSALHLALESYRRHYGVFPATSGTNELWSAVSGRRGPDGSPGRGSPFLDLTRCRLADEDLAAPLNALLDPWGLAYRFVVPAGGAGRAFTLYSAGPDGRDQPAPGQEGPDPAHPDNQDNLTISEP